MTTRDVEDWADKAVKFGPGWVVAVVLIWFLINSVSASQAETVRKLDKVADVLATADSDRKLDAQRTGYLLKAICLNSADNEAQRANCAEAAR